MNIGENIKKFRKEKGYDQMKLAELLNVSNRTVSSWEIGRTEPNMGMVENIASVLGINKTDLVNGYRTVEVEHVRESDAPAFTIEELQLLDLFRTLPDAKRSEVIQYCKFLASEAKREKKKDTASSKEA
jgi:transcriptional regulator with XRE-family HTH domain